MQHGNAEYRECQSLKCDFRMSNGEMPFCSPTGYLLPGERIHKLKAYAMANFELIVPTGAGKSNKKSPRAIGGFFYLRLFTGGKYYPKYSFRVASVVGMAGLSDITFSSASNSAGPSPRGMATCPPSAAERSRPIMASNPL